MCFTLFWISGHPTDSLLSRVLTALEALFRTVRPLWRRTAFANALTESKLPDEWCTLSNFTCGLFSFLGGFDLQEEFENVVFLLEVCGCLQKEHDFVVADDGFE